MESYYKEFLTLSALFMSALFLIRQVATSMLFKETAIIKAVLSF